MQSYTRHLAPNVPTYFQLNSGAVLLAFVSIVCSKSEDLQAMSIIERQARKWAVTGLGVSVTTMEEVFLRVGEIAERELHKKDEDERNGEMKSKRSV